MEKNIVTLDSIRKKASSDLGLTAKFISLLVFAGAICLLFTLKLHDLQKSYLFGIALGVIVLLNVGAWLLGRYSKHFQIRAALDWYRWDMNRIKLFNELKEEWRNKFEADLSAAVEELLIKEPDARNELKEIAIQTLKDFLTRTKQQKDTIDARLNDDEVELVRVLQLKSTIEEQEERMTEWLLEFISDLKRESENEHLSKERLLSLLRKENIPALEEKLGYYEILLASCKKSTHDLSVILREHYNFHIEE